MENEKSVYFSGDINFALDRYLINVFKSCISPSFFCFSSTIIVLLSRILLLMSSLQQWRLVKFHYREADKQKYPFVFGTLMKVAVAERISVNMINIKYLIVVWLPRQTGTDQQIRFLCYYQYQCG